MSHHPPPSTTRSTVQRIVALPFVPFVMLWDLLCWIGRGIARAFGALFATIGRFVWWLLLPARWAFAQLWRGLCALGRVLATGLGWVWRRLLRPVLLILLLPLVWVADAVLGLLARLGRGVAAASRWVWRLLRPVLTTAAGMAATCWRWLARVAGHLWRGVTRVALVLYWPFRPLVKAVGVVAHAVGRAVSSTAAACRDWARGVRSWIWQ